MRISHRFQAETYKDKTTILISTHTNTASRDTRSLISQATPHLHPAIESTKKESVSRLKCSKIIQSLNAPHTPSLFYVSCRKKQLL